MQIKFGVLGTKLNIMYLNTTRTLFDEIDQFETLLWRIESWEYKTLTKIMYNTVFLKLLYNVWTIIKETKGWWKSLYHRKTPMVWVVYVSAAMCNVLFDIWSKSLFFIFNKFLVDLISSLIRIVVFCAWMSSLVWVVFFINYWLQEQ